MGGCAANGQSRRVAVANWNEQQIYDFLVKLQTDPQAAPPAPDVTYQERKKAAAAAPIFTPPSAAAASTASTTGATQSA
jgi:hypothetical protein